MGKSKTIAGFFFASVIFYHNLHYTVKYVGISPTSLLFLAGVFAFQVVLFLKASGHVIVMSRKAKRWITVLRVLLLLLMITFCITEHAIMLAGKAIRVVELVNCVISVVLVVFPEIVFEILFSIRIKKNKKPLKKNGNKKLNGTAKVIEDKKLKEKSDSQKSLTKVD